MTSQFQRTGIPCTVLFVDVCGSTGLYDTLGNARAQAVIAKTLGLLSRSAIRHTGTIVKNIGDELMCTFAIAHDAAEAAVAMQRSVRRPAVLEDMGVKSLAIRIGFHTGPVIARGSDVFGDTVNVAARVVAHAKPGQIHITKQALGKLPQDAKVRPVGSIQVKGRKGLIDLFEIVWERKDLTVVKGVAQSTSRSTSDSIRLIAKLGETSIELGHGRPVLHMGRGHDNEFVIADPLASRLHARIEFRRDRFVLIDQSLNGTYLHRQGKAEIALRRDEISLDRSGQISLGKSTTAPPPELCVRFSIRKGR
jgi:class 3 adenylate cyclase